MKSIAIILGLFLTIILVTTGCNAKNEMKVMEQKTEVVTLGAGCFWCVEAIFSRVNGVIKVESGYSGGEVENPSYQEVCTGNTGHAEVVQVTFNPDIIPFSKILEIYFKTHDPTTLNRQGADIGTQYRSVIFYHTEEQKRIATEIKNQLDGASIWSSPIVTSIEPFKNFYKAENYHQNYYEDNRNQPYCRMVITPKLDKFEKIFSDYVKKND
ncbi:peptide-methionine (S)-S-oxide reductase MsrA [Tenuifilum thalassicum]|uniref:Peptide methionine sulfoxide reductase MsrA n=1 Tax=Tenuifilum thalassicum TaxID=2590900 RepID=A0A7D3XZB7_9BACT|nr:peptide-methionine (S)-S-oxide reductase MsrA [Tenuifilum thalassicum]QKG79813.1 peptide-methionine (S)-S-oxide reductase MsrA [Tenuifilum thalassicum]